MTSIIIRRATQADVPGMTDIFFQSFNQKFWQYFCPDEPANRAFISDMWSRGIETPTDRSFVAIDTAHDSKTVGVSRWQIPQVDGSQNHEAWPEPWMLDQEIAQPFFGGMDENRAAIMGKTPHFYLDMIGIHEQYQSKGVAKNLMAWGIERADQEGFPVFLHSTQVAQTFYAKQYDFKIAEPIFVPDRPEYGSFRYTSMVREPKSDCGHA